MGYPPTDLGYAILELCASGVSDLLSAYSKKSPEVQCDFLRLQARSPSLDLINLWVPCSKSETPLANNSSLRPVFCSLHKSIQVQVIA